MLRLHTWLLPALVVLAASAVAQPQNYPVKPIRLVVPLAPGGGNDTLARYMGKHLTDNLGQQIVVENRPGGGGRVGAEHVARAAPDGYTLLMSGTGQLVVSLTHGKPDMRTDFAPIAIIGEYPSLLAVHPSLPVVTVNDLIKLAKSRPGQINYASAGNGSAGHLVMEMLRTMAGIDIVHIPYKGAGPAMIEVMAGQVSLIFNNPLASLPHVKAGRLRALAVSGSRRMTAAPDIPTVAESGLPGFDATLFLGILGPAATPRDIVTRLNGEVVKIVQRREVQNTLLQQGMEPVGSTPEQFAARIRSDMDKLAKVIRDSGLRLN
ncbi:MAG: hypothetical protein A3G24_09190 [Betaproteobacteria bacterium RIFCSPLOWO2_12_FULL_62_13]|nr:MAG: hypothetical protein A3G24_09190 [Betaproteobacteria bacterium RIFCSPLOWO2_12_FULL_62_13]